MIYFELAFALLAEPASTAAFWMGVSMVVAPASVFFGFGAWFADRYL